VAAEGQMRVGFDNVRAALFVDGLSDAAAFAGSAKGDKMIGFGKISLGCLLE